MCGIMGIHFKKPKDKGIGQERLEAFVNAMLLSIESRGKDATGLLTVDNHGVPTLIKADVAASTFVNWRDPIPKKVRTILGHTRLATQGVPTNLDNNHPVQFGSCFAIHNGHISNDTELFQTHSLDRQAEVDSEIIPALFNKYGLDNPRDVLEELEGGYAIAAVDPDRFPGMTVLAKGWSSPLKVLETKYAWVWASTDEAILKACEAVLGFKPSASKIEDYTVGDMLVIQGDKAEKKDFWPKSYSSSRTTYVTTNYGSGSYYYSPTTGSQGTTHREGFTEDLCDSCGCKRLWHGSANDPSGPCSHTINLAFNQGTWDCRCVGFVEPKNKRSMAMEFCDGCGREFNLGDLVKIGQTYLCPNVCAKDGVFSPGPTTEELRKAAESIITARIDAAIEYGDGDELSEEATAAADEEAYRQTLFLASKVTGLTTKFIDWLLFQAPSELFSFGANKYLIESQKVAEAAYDKAHNDLYDEVANIDQTRWASGDVLLGVAISGSSTDDEDEEIEECGVVVLADYRDEEVIA